jgi:hypothetical protein
MVLLAEILTGLGQILTDFTGTTHDAGGIDVNFLSNSNSKRGRQLSLIRVRTTLTAVLASGVRSLGN